MYKKILFLILAGFQFVAAQTVSEVSTTGRFSTCNITPEVSIEFLPESTGSEIIDGNIVCTDPCGVTKLRVTVSNIRWDQSPGANWFHGLFFPEGEGVSVTGIIMPDGWAHFPTCTGASCSLGVTGGEGFYFDGTSSNSCCTGASVNDGIPHNNYGDITMSCSLPVTVQFDLSVCNSTFTDTTRTFMMSGTADGNTGCWSTPDNLENTLSFAINTVPCEGTCETTCEETLDTSFVNTLSDFTVYPNPSKGVFEFSEKVMNITAFDMSGKLVKSQNKASTKLDLSNLPNGSYLIRGTTESGKSFTRKVIKN